MKICMLSAFYHPITAGSEVFTKEISERLAADGHEVHVVTGEWCKGLRRLEDVNGVKVHRIPSVLIKNLALPSVIPGMLLKGLEVARKCDIIHAHLAFPPGFLGALLKRLTGKPLITTVQGGDAGIYPDSGLGRFFPIIKPCVSYSLKNSDTTTAISDFLAQKSSELGATNIALVRNGTDTERFNPDVPFDAVKEKYGIEGGPLLLTVSRLVPKNGVDVLISAFARILKDFPKAKLIIAGDGPEMEDLKALAKKERVEDSTYFLGYVQHDEIPAFMNMADAFIRVSLEEGLGIVFTEAMACKTPVVGTSVGGIPDVVDDGRTGFLVQPKDIDATAAAINRILSDPEASRTMAERGYETIEREFSWQSIYAKMLEVYKTVLETKR